jgi:hypothetical protein
MRAGFASRPHGLQLATQLLLEERTLSEQNSGTLPEPVELTRSELEIVAGGKPIAFVKQPNKAYVSMGNDNWVRNRGGDVNIGSDNMVWITQTSTNSPNAMATGTTPPSS